MCCGSLGEVLQGGSVDKRRRGGWEEGLLTHLGAGGGVEGGLLTSGQPCKSKKPRRWPRSKVCLVNRGDPWQKMKWSTKAARTTSLHFFPLLLGSVPLCFTEWSTWVQSSISTSESWTEITVDRVLAFFKAQKIQSRKKKWVVLCTFCFLNTVKELSQMYLRQNCVLILHSHRATYISVWKRPC